MNLPTTWPFPSAEDQREARRGVTRTSNAQRLRARLTTWITDESEIGLAREVCEVAEGSAKQVQILPPLTLSDITDIPSAPY